ncbi:PDZ/DHR/GLGF domain protein [Ancylostoma duodenale]|uniref:PDZ/DHR/GLGF domain protein n=1 Tax=Ancylostoma duodenale TaxID=51022 RepID=A0A0C2GN25_9BILA|nr:PDZ/DHR/GLGF domain protein [Ancylostoma duodenale]
MLQMIKSRSLNFPCSQTQRISCSGSVDEIRALIHTTRTSHWEPPWASWKCRLGLPYGWEQAKDDAGNIYFIEREKYRFYVRNIVPGCNEPQYDISDLKWSVTTLPSVQSVAVVVDRHINRTTTYTDPRDSSAPEGQRTVSLHRHPEIGFGFVAAGQHPTVIQFVSAEGPSDGLLYANDQILAVNGVDVRQETKDNVVAMVRSADDELELTVEQLPSRPRSARRSCRVRFTDRVLVASVPDGTDFPPPLPNALRVYLENGQTRSFRYDETTTVRDILNSIFSKLQLRAKSYFALAVEYSLGARSSRISLLRPETKIVEIIRMPNSDHIRCVFRFAFIPKDMEALWLEDPRALDYYYQQCTADVVRGRYAFEMRYEACIRLAALHMQQVAVESHLLKENNTVSLTRLESEYGMNSFLPSILLENVKRREIRKHIRYYLKRDSVKLSESLVRQTSTYGSGQQSLLLMRVNDTSVSLRVRYLDLLAHLPTFGGRGFSVTFKESQIDMIMQIDPRAGLLVRHPGKTGRPTISIDYDLIDHLVGLEFLVDKDDIDDLVVYICGYQLIHCNRNLVCDVDDSPPPQMDPPTNPPPYSAVHMVIPSGWNYSSEIATSEQSLDLTADPPPYELANSFAEPHDEKKEENVTNIPERTPPSERRNSEVAKKLLRATDSLLTKNSQKLQKKEMISPIVAR